MTQRGSVAAAASNVRAVVAVVAVVVDGYCALDCRRSSVLGRQRFLNRKV